MLTIENALSELLTKLDAVESYGFKTVRDARKELMVRPDREEDCGVGGDVIETLREGQRDDG